MPQGLSHEVGPSGMTSQKGDMINESCAHFTHKIPESPRNYQEIIRLLRQSCIKSTAMRAEESASGMPPPGCTLPPTKYRSWILEEKLA